MKRKPIRLVIDEESFRAATERLFGAQDAIGRVILIGGIPNPGSTRAWRDARDSTTWEYSGFLELGPVILAPVHEASHTHTMSDSLK